ncbi:MAG: Mur ligase domain-containing protein [Candidatus Adiutrix sp.]|jgi:UDP-N-acetylmuramoyl-L-alanyl-D-glutamate--2,6-diaminopimelate ligase|nr:Mur ligase domain-containing protein [Candidatus Adiutrix sp.]
MVKLARLAAELGLEIRGDGDPDITGLTEDSRLIEPGMMFAAVRGAQADARAVISDAESRGAAAV